MDWFHIGKKFKTGTNALGEIPEESLEEALEKVKWSLWHGNAEATLRKIALLQDNLLDEKKKLKKL